jgi:multiple sugar transport system ATP-binding protein
VATITFDDVGKIYPGGTRAIEGVNMEIEDGEFVVLVGPSGCGKSTLLRMIAGLEEISEGTISIGDRVVNDVAPKDRDIAMVFQNYALYPHMTVYDNMAFGLKLRKFSKDDIERRVQEAARILEITEYLDRKPKALSGGQRQRVAMGRAIVREPSAFLMDEPLSNLDAKLRVQMRSELGLLHSRLATTTVYVTHDQVEAMTMGDRVAVMRKGVLQQVDSPTTLYTSPTNLFVAGFIGSPSMNFIGGKLTRIEGSTPALTYGNETLALRRVPEHFSEGEIVVGIRPEAFEVVGEGEETEGRVVEAEAELVEQLGSDAFVHFELPVKPVITPDIRELLEDQGADESTLGDTTKMVARVDPHRAPRNGEKVRLVVDTEKVHFFDRESGDVIT